MLAPAEITSRVEKARETFTETAPRAERSAIGQFLTPAPIARFMASLFEGHPRAVRILDPGAGAGSLFAALVEQLLSGPTRPRSIEVAAYETDPNIAPQLEATADLCQHSCARMGVAFQAKLRGEDFVSAAAPRIENGLFDESHDDFTHVILNPPYKKINGETRTRRLLNSAGIEVSNLYAAFVWLAAHLLRPEGEIVAITPRSFCNGPYFRRFRRSLLSLIDLRHVHTFESRKEAFAADSVLQENIIFHGVRGHRQKKTVKISVSKGPAFDEVRSRIVPFREVVAPRDPDVFIHLIESEDAQQVLEQMSEFTTTLAELGMDVSTGRVVDFRARDSIKQDPEPGDAPLIYPCHFENGFVRWPVKDAKKPNAIVSSAQTEDLLIASGYYVLTKRFTSKEERRRIVAAVFDPTRIETPSVGFENHLNYFHARGRGLSAEMARGLAVFLNSSLLDHYFRSFSGHTQVNATDLRKMRYPSKQQIVRLGRAAETVLLTQDRIDSALEKVRNKNG